MQARTEFHPGHGSNAATVPREPISLADYRRAREDYVHGPHIPENIPQDVHNLVDAGLKNGDSEIDFPLGEYQDPAGKPIIHPLGKAIIYMVEHWGKEDISYQDGRISLMEGGSKTIAEVEVDYYAPKIHMKLDTDSSEPEEVRNSESHRRANNILLAIADAITRTLTPEDEIIRRGKEAIARDRAQYAEALAVLRRA